MVHVVTDYAALNKRKTKCLLFRDKWNPFLYLMIILMMSYLYIIYTEQKKLRKSQKTMKHKNTKADNCSIFIYLLRYMSSVEKHVYFKLLAPMPLL